ncbi:MULTISPECIES: hypothetical protein [unclassified Rathayibacter]|uniref:hypothetical protein n=1 Tax=unclassified Rathayibacter TaxID=2609250 RepID=UPI0006F265F0|nr:MULTISPECIES: hypothetical protein [unclassified Rathayibacter]
MLQDSRHLSRRTVATGAAWTIPAVAVAVAAPMAAASTTPPEPDLYNFAAQGGGALPGQKINAYVRIRNRSTNLAVQGQVGIVFFGATTGFELRDLSGNVVTMLPGTPTDASGRSFPSNGGVYVKEDTVEGTLGSLSASWTSPAPESRLYSTDSLDLEAL